MPKLFRPLVRVVLILSSVLFLGLFLASCATSSKHLTGMASWYGKQFQGRKTANGEIFDMHELTAAHRKLPFGTKVRVTSLSSQKSVVVRINDRGPFAHNRVIDLSYEAARRIGIVELGHDKVTIEVVGN